MMKKTERKYTVVSNNRIARDVYELILSGFTGDFTAPGQFVNIKLDGFFLRRPISVCDAVDGILTLVYKVVGGGTDAMSRLEKGAELDMLTALGNGFSPELCPDGCALIGGGVGCPPVYALAKELKRRGKSFSVILGFNGAEDIFYRDKFAALTDELYICAVDGSICAADGCIGIKGFVTDALAAMDKRPGYICACGPLPMLAALAKTGIPGQVSLEERMGCGFGGCMGCSVMTKNGAKRVCREGPVFDISEVIW